MLNRMQRSHSFFTLAILTLPIFGLQPGCASTQEGTAGSGLESALSGPKPSAHCEQYLALMSDERKQPLLPQYGQGGTCWTGGKQQEKQCDDTCIAGVNQIIRSNLQSNQN